MSKAVLGVGTATFIAGYGLAADTPSMDAAAEILRDAIAAGIRYVDTAAGYGEAESVVGRVAHEVRDHGVRVCTKVTAAAAGANGLEGEARASLRRLKLDRVDTLLLHSVDESVLRDSTLSVALDSARAAGLAERTGVSTYGATDARTALQQSWCGAVQVEHSVLNPSVVAAIAAQHHQAQIVVRSVLCKGLLTGRRKHAREVAAALGPTLDALDRLAAEWGWPLTELAIRFALDTPGVDVVVVGISSTAELLTALSAFARPPLGSDARTLLARFDCSDADAAHPERWPAAV